jgi:hypothetical protein
MYQTVRNYSAYDLKAVLVVMVRVILCTLDFSNYHCHHNRQSKYIDIFINCSWVVTQWQYTFTQKQYIEQHK